MLYLRDFEPYQRKTINFQVAHLRTMIWLFTGSGKTAITLTTIAHLLQHGIIRAALVIGPMRVIQSVWHREALKWDHLKHLKFSIVHGDKALRTSALFTQADVYLVNYDNLPWFVNKLKGYFLQKGFALPFNMVVADEVTRVKNADGIRASEIGSLLPYFPYRTGLTGTPSSNGLIDLHGQYKFIDDGQRLGVEKADYERAFFNCTGYNNSVKFVSDENKTRIYQVISDITIEMSQKDYIKLPPLVINDMYIDLPKQARSIYNKLEKDLFAELDSGEEIEIVNELCKSNKLLQLANGAIYTNVQTRAWRTVQNAKLDALDTIVEEAGGTPILLAYNFKSDASRICKKYKFAENLTGLSGSNFIDTIQRFKEGKIKLLLGHPKSMGHGVDGLQYNDAMLVWFGLCWSLEYYLQFNGRVERRGREKPVLCHRLLARDTFDEVVSIRLVMRSDTQDTLRQAVKQYRLAQRL